MTEPTCNFCSASDKFRCKTLKQAHSCDQYRHVVKNRSIPDTDYHDLTPTYMLKVGGTYKLVEDVRGNKFEDGGEWTILRVDDKNEFYGTNIRYHGGRVGVPLRSDGLWATLHDPALPRPGFDEWALSLAVAVAGRSRDPSTKVGAVIIRSDKTICSLGYNGFPRQMEDKSEWWNLRSEKYARVIHAEMNAILNATEPVTGMTLYVTHPPCENCAKHVAAAGITRIVCGASDEIRERFNVDRSLEIFQDCGIEVGEIEYGRNNNNASKSGQGAEASSCKTC